MKENKEQKSGSPIFILIIFIVLLGFVFVIPEIYQKYQSSLAETFGIGSKNQNSVTNNEDTNFTSVSDYYQINSNGNLSYNEINVSNVTLTNNSLSFDIKTENTIDLTSLNYYIEFYQNKQVFLGRRILKGEVNKAKNIKIDVSGLDITSNTYFNISHIEDSAIPKFNLETDESGIGNITCIKNNNSYSYDFSLDSLVRVLYKYTYSNNDLNTYTDKLLEYQKLTKEYNSLNGVNALVTDNNTTFIYTLELDYSDIQTFNKITDDYKFKKGEYSYIIKFKMDAEGYTCI